MVAERKETKRTQTNKHFIVIHLHSVKKTIHYTILHYTILYYTHISYIHYMIVINDKLKILHTILYTAVHTVINQQGPPGEGR